MIAQILAVLISKVELVVFLVKPGRSYSVAPGSIDWCIGDFTTQTRGKLHVCFNR